MHRHKNYKDNWLIPNWSSNNRHNFEFSIPRHDIANIEFEKTEHNFDNINSTPPQKLRDFEHEKLQEFLSGCEVLWKRHASEAYNKSKKLELVEHTMKNVLEEITNQRWHINHIQKTLHLHPGAVTQSKMGQRKNTFEISNDTTAKQHIANRMQESKHGQFVIDLTHDNDGAETKHSSKRIRLRRSCMNHATH